MPSWFVVRVLDVVIVSEDVYFNDLIIGLIFVFIIIQTLINATLVNHSRLKTWASNDDTDKRSISAQWVVISCSNVQNTVKLIRYLLGRLPQTVATIAKAWRATHMLRTVPAPLVVYFNILISEN